MFTHLFGRLTNRASSQASPRRRVALNLARLEERCVPAVLMESGAPTSIPTWGIQPTPPPIDSALNSLYYAVSIGTKDIHNQPVDFNQDGYPDLVQTGVIDEQIGYGTKTDPINAFSRGGFGKVAFGGPNGLTYSTTGTPNHGIAVQFTGSFFAVADLNEDGFQDILSLNNASQTGAGAHTVRHLWDPVQQSFTKVDGGALDAWADRYGQLTLGDVNGDLIPDLITQNYSTTPVVLPDGTRVLPMIGFQVFLGISDPSAGHWVGDFASTSYATINLRQPSTAWGIELFASNRKVDTDAYTPVVNTVLADLNGDGSLDLAIPEADGITVFPNPGDGKFTQPSALFFQTAGSANGLNLTSGDFNNDGKIDLATSPNIVSLALLVDISPNIMQWQASNAPISIFLNTTPAGGTTDFSLTPVPGFATDGFAWNGTIALADFNGDGNLDLGVANGSSQSTLFGIVEGDGKGNFGTIKQYIGYSNEADGYDPNYKRAMAYLNTADFNNDGQIDITTTALNIDSGKTVGTPAVGITAIPFNKTFATPVINIASLVPATVGQPYTQQLLVTGGDPGKPFSFALNAQSVPLPAGLTMSPTGLITGTPTQPGPFQLTFNISQPNGPKGTSMGTLTVNNAQPGVVVISPATLPGGKAGVAYSQLLTATGGTGAVNFALSAGTLPAGLTLSFNGLISGTPTTTGPSSFTVSATDSVGNVGYAQYGITIGTNPTPPLAGPFIAAGSGQGGLVSIFNANGTPRQTFAPYGTGYQGAITVAQGDVNGDGVADLVTGTGAGVAPHVLVLDGNTLAVISSFYAYAEQFLGGVRVAAGDVDGNGKAEVVTGTGPGSAPNVCVFNGTTGATQQSFYAYAPEYLGGINVGAGDVTGDGKADIITGSGVGVSPHVVVFDSATAQALYSFYAYLPQFKGGVNVGAGDVDGDGKVDILTGAGPGGDPHVKVFSGADGTQKQSFDAFAVDFNGGVSVASADLNQDGKADIIAGTQTQSAQVKAFNATDLSVLDDFFAFQGAVGVWVAGK